MDIDYLKSLRNKGLSYQKIGTLFGTSRQRIHQLVNSYSTNKRKTIPGEPRTRSRNPLKEEILKKKVGVESLPINPIKDGQLSVVREWARIRDNRTCQICHKEWVPGTRRLDVHHLDEDRQQSRDCKWDMENLDRLITLCHKCHFNLEYFKKKQSLALKAFHS